MHKKEIDSYKWSLEDLAEDIGNLDYDSLQRLFELLSKKFSKDAEHDFELQHPNVWTLLNKISQTIESLCKQELKSLSNICRPYNEKEIK
jgi:hypothetical protein